jgi:integrase
MARTNLRRRGRSWCVVFRSGGRQHWRSFADRDHGGEKGAKEAAELFLAQTRAEVIRGGVFETPRNATVSDALDEWLRYSVEERRIKTSTETEYRSSVETHLRPVFGHLRLREVTPPVVEAWKRRLLERGLSPRSVNKLLTNLHGVFGRARKAYGLRSNPVAGVERLPERYSGELEFFSPEEVMALVRAAACERDAAIFLTAAFTGLRRGELVALRWRDVDFAGEAIRVRASYTYGALTAPKSGKVRSVPMVPEVARALARLAANPADDELVFPGERGEYLDGSALRRRYEDAIERAGVRRIRFHDLRHTFGSLAINRASIVEV